MLVQRFGNVKMLSVNAKKQQVRSKKLYTYPTVDLFVPQRFGGEALEWMAHPLASCVCRVLGGGGGWKQQCGDRGCRVA